MAMPAEREKNIIRQFNEDFFADIVVPVASAVKLGTLVGLFRHMSQAWSLGKALL